MSHKIEVRTKQDPNIKMKAPPRMKPYLMKRAIAAATNKNPKVFVVIAKI